MNWSRWHTLFTGLALIAVVNGIAISGVAYNRSGEPESKLRLSERELYPPYVWRGNKENSGLSLTLQWRVLPRDAEYSKKTSWRYSTNGAAPAWLNEEKMKLLGFAVKPAAIGGSVLSDLDHQLPRDVLLVLELNGISYQTVLARAKKYSEDASDGEKLLKDEQNENSRLFLVDADIDQSTLRAKYPDRSRFAIVRGQVRPEPSWQRDGGAHPFFGIVSSLSIDNLNVPLEFKSVFEGASAVRSDSEKNNVRYDVDVSFGHRLEPWITRAARRLP